MDKLEWQNWHDPDDPEFVLWKFGAGDCWSVHSYRNGWWVRPPIVGWAVAPGCVFPTLEAAKTWVEIEASNHANS